MLLDPENSPSQRQKAVRGVFISPRYQNRSEGILKPRNMVEKAHKIKAEMNINNDVVHVYNNDIAKQKPRTGVIF